MKQVEWIYYRTILYPIEQIKGAEVVIHTAL
jgi:hypothetical protein